MFLLILSGRRINDRLENGATSGRLVQADAHHHALVPHLVCADNRRLCPRGSLSLSLALSVRTAFCG